MNNSSHRAEKFRKFHLKGNAIAEIFTIIFIIIIFAAQASRQQAG